MPRDIEPGALTRLTNDVVRTCHLVRISTGSGPARATDWAGDLIWDGNRYLALGHLLSIGDIVEGPDLEITSVTLSLSGVDQAYIALALSARLIQRELHIWRAIIDAEYKIVLSPILIFQGRMDGAVIEDDPDSGSCVVSVTAWSEFGDLTGVRGRYTTDPMQQALFPGDTIFMFASDAPKDLPWGRASE